MPTIQTITNPSGTFPYVPNTRTLTINGVSYDLSADRSWTISTSGTGTVTSVALSATMPTGLVASITGSPITSNGTLGLTVTMQSGYAIPTTTKQGQWDSAYAFTSTFPSGTAQQLLRVNTLGTALEFFTPSFLVSTDIIASSPLVWNSGTKTMSIPAATSSVNGYLTSTDWLTFSSKQNAITLTTTGNSGSATLVGATLNIPTYTLAGLGGMTNPFSAALGQIIYSNSAGAPLSLAPNTTTTKKYLVSVGDGTNGDAPYWDTVTGFLAGSGTTGYIPKFTASGTIGDSIMVEASGVITTNGTSKIYTQQAGTGSSSLYIDNRDTTAAQTNSTIISTQHLGSGRARTIINAASYTSGNLTRGEFSIVTENGNQFVANIGTQFSSGDNAFSIYSTSAVENIRLNTGGNSFLMGGNVGIGINTPTAKLEVSGNIYSNVLAGNAFSLNSAGANYGFIINNSANTFSLGYGTSIGTIGTSVLTWNSSTNVGINQINPTERLDVVGNIKLSGYVTGGSWQGNAVYPAYGGTGATSLTGVVIGNGTLSMTAVAGTSGQLLRRNVANTDYEFFTPNFVTNPMTSLGDMIYGNAAGAALRLAPNTSTTKKYLAMVGDGTSGDAPYWDTITGFTGTGTTNYVTKFTSSSAIGNSLLYDSGVGVSIGNTSPQKLVHIAAANGSTVMRMENTDTTVSIGETIGAIEFYGNDTASGVGAIIDAHGGGLSGEVSVDIWAGTNGSLVGGVTVKYTGAVNFTPLNSAPSPAAAGDVYYDSSTNMLRCYNGTTWNDLF